MQEFIFEQKVKFRRRRGGITISPFRADSDDYLIRQIKQKPAAKRKSLFQGTARKSRLPFARREFPFAPLFRRAIAAIDIERITGANAPRRPNPLRALARVKLGGWLGRSGWLSQLRLRAISGLLGKTRAIRDLPLFPLAVTAGAILACSVLALPWGDDNFRFLPDESFIPAPADSEVRIELAGYAGLLPPFSGAEEAAVPQEDLETFAWTDYTVQKGDSVSRIAQRFGVSMDAIIAGNGIDNARKLKTGDKLRIPNMDGIPYTVRRGDTLQKISGANEVPLTAILDANDLADDRIAAGTVLFLPGARMKKEDLRLALGDGFAWPLRGRLSSRFGWRKDPITGLDGIHKGIDIAAPRGTTVKAAMAGRVSYAGVNALYGKHVIVSHGKGIQTLYGHLSKISVKAGTWLEQGTKLGEVGSTGYSTGNHLHFSIFKSGRAVNPLDYL